MPPFYWLVSDWWLALILALNIVLKSLDLDYWVLALVWFEILTDDLVLDLPQFLFIFTAFPILLIWGIFY